MNSPARSLFIRAARDTLSAKLGVEVDGLKSDIVDWEGADGVS